MATTLKHAYLVRRNPALSAAAFPTRWRQHSELGEQFPDLLRRHARLTYCLVDHEHGAAIGTSPIYDGIGLLFLRSPEMLDMPNADPAATPTMRADELKVFHQNVFNSAIAAEETIVKDGPDARVAVLTFGRRRAGVPAPDATQGNLTDVPAYMRNVRRHVRNKVIGTPTIECDVLTELWFDTVADATDTFDDPAFQDALGDEAILDPAGTMRFLIEVCHDRRY